MHIREFTMSDYAAVYDLWQKAGGGVSLRPSDRPEEIEKKLTRGPDLFLVAEEDEKVVGAIMGGLGWEARVAASPGRERRVSRTGHRYGAGDQG